MDAGRDPHTNTEPELRMTIRSSLIRTPLHGRQLPALVAHALSPTAINRSVCGLFRPVRARPRTLSLVSRMRPGTLRTVAFLTCLAGCQPADPARDATAAKGGVTVALASPIGYVKIGDRRIIWRQAPGIARYEVVLSDSVETPIFTAVTADTQVVVPADLRYSLSQNYRWYVTAYRDSDSTAWRSPVAIFRLEGEGRRMPPMPRP